MSEEGKCGGSAGCGSGSCGGSEGCGGNCESCKGNNVKQRIEETMNRIKRKIVVLSGKGGVGKSTVSVNLAFALAATGAKVGLLDVDIHGPSAPKMLNLDGMTLSSDGEKIIPIEIGTLKVVSLAFLLQNPDDAVIWRGPVKLGVIRQFLSDVDWGDLDYLVVDTPPGTGDEPLTVCQILKDAGAVIVTTPQEVSAADVRKSISFCRQLDLNILGIVENMSGFVCPHCGEVTEIFAGNAGEKLAERYGLPLLGKIPIDPAVSTGGDAGNPFARVNSETPAAKSFAGIVKAIG